MNLYQRFNTGILLCLLCVTATTAQADSSSRIRALEGNFTQIANQLGLQCEDHDVVTKDGYILSLFHVPGDPARPVFLLSGNMGSADDYIARGNTSLPAVLAREGYDVWVGNWRGCKYGRRHTTLDPDRDTKFWDYSIHEYAKYDAPAHIDYVLNKTGSPRVACVGWSMGTTTFYLLGAMRPEYNDKVAVVISFAPIGYLHHWLWLKNSVLPIYPFINGIMNIMNIHEIVGENSTAVTLIRHICRSEDGYELCIKGWFFPLLGADSTNIEPHFTPILFSHFPSGISRKSTNHMIQITESHKIREYDYGAMENLNRYGSMSPPGYELERNTMPVVLISGMNDEVSTLPDVELLKARLPNVVDHVLLEPPNFTHMDFPYGKNSHETLYKPHVLNYLTKFLPANNQTQTT